MHFDSYWENAYFGSFPKFQWVEDTFSEHSVDKIRVRFYVNRWLLSPVTAKLHEIQIYQVDQ